MQLDFYDKAVAPGMSLLVAKSDKVLFEKSIGFAQILPKKIKLKSNTIFDIASLTKPFVTATLMMLAFQEKKIKLSQSLSDFYPSLKKSKIKLSNLLNHTSGLPAWKPLYDSQAIDEILNLAQQSKPNKKTEYSDLGYILLGDILERIYGNPLDEIFKKKIANPLKLKNTFFIPLFDDTQKKLRKKFQFATTEYCPLRNRYLNGEVDDENAWSMGGVAGHAGLFSTANEIFIWLRELAKAKTGISKLIHQKTFKIFCDIPSKRNLQKRYFTLGFDTPSLPSSSGKYFSPNSLGHLGYTGTSFWWDLEKDITIILLTNRLHPKRGNDRIKKFRPHIHNRVRHELSI